MHSFLGSGPFWILLISGLLLGYLSPIIIGAIRHVEAIGVIIFLIFFPPLWPAALLGAFMLPRSDPRYPLPRVWL